MIKGRVTIPTDKNMNDYIKDIIEKWGADAIRDCDGTKLGEEITGLGVKNYSTYLTTRNDQNFIRENMDEVQQLYLMSEPVVATSNNIEIDLLKGYFKEQFDVDKVHDEKLWWEVIDRTTGEVLDNDKWTFDRENEKVLIEDVVMWHKYTVNFLVYMIWDPTQMYNHITNDWGDKPHEVPYDCRQPKSQKHMLELLEKWLDENPEIDVVRFTTFFHHFTLCFNEIGKEKFVDWFGYSSSVSPKAMEDFEKDKGYKLRPEDIVDEGYYNSPFRVPTKEYKDYIDFQSKWVASLAKKMVDMCHEKGKEAMMFLGDNWIGTEPYGKYFESIGLDAVVGSVGNGATMRMISDIPGVKYTEGRFLPYFFPDVFTEGGDPVKEGQENWLQARRAILRKPLERIGYGGYLGLTKEFPEFVDEVEKICNEFREIHETTKGTKSYTSLKVGVLNSWGKLRTWQTNQVAHALWYREIYSYVGVIECLSGMPVDVEFISFDDIKERGISDDIKVIINAGDAYTAWSGGDNWMDEKLVSKIREWVYNGGGFIGVGDPTACQYQGRYFQLDDVMGVDKEIGFSLSTRKYNDINDKHFLLEDIDEELDFGEGMDGVYAKGDNYQILSKDREYSNLVVNTFGNGRSVYFAGLPYTPQNCRLLLRAVYFAAGREDEMKKYYVTNVNTECAAFEELGKVVVINNTRCIQNTDLIIDGEIKEQLKLNPMEMRWIEYK
ncbi:1,3-beta-galactosyl-N-acetylhexosamine phosphorylase [Clostridium sardiniense]|uniref:1,3-beta-galactosyl-N-acetylhexosamine phosphorylase n=1 Tax=Clostridium sardiniense TaxID=29369 RepID=UPI003D33DE14